MQPACQDMLAQTWVTLCSPSLNKATTAKITRAKIANWIDTDCTSVNMDEDRGFRGLSRSPEETSFNGKYYDELNKLMRLQKQDNKIKFITSTN